MGRAVPGAPTAPSAAACPGLSMGFKGCSSVSAVAGFGAAVAAVIHEFF